MNEWVMNDGDRSINAMAVDAVYGDFWINTPFHTLLINMYQTSLSGKSRMVFYWWQVLLGSKNIIKKRFMGKKKIVFFTAVGKRE